MKITASGWGRNLGPTKILDRDIRHSVIDKEISQQEMALQKLEDQSINIVWHASTRMNGDYVWELHTSPEEIVDLFLTAFQDKSLDEIPEKRKKSKARLANRLGENRSENPKYKEHLEKIGDIRGVD